MMTQRARFPRRGFLAGASVAAALLTAIGHANAPAGRYTTSTLNGVVVVLDTRTQLTWQQSSGTGPVAITWSQAQLACADLGAGWRLPSVEELETIVDETIVPPSPAIDSTFSALAGCYWTLTPLPNQATPFTAAWCVDFLDGRQHSDPASKNLIRCVR